MSYNARPELPTSPMTAVLRRILPLRAPYSCSSGSRAVSSDCVYAFTSCVCICQIVCMHSPFVYVYVRLCGCIHLLCMHTHAMLCVRMRVCMRVST